MKEGKISNGKIAYIIPALLLIVLCFVGYVKGTEMPKRQVDVLFLGDSLIGQFRDETSVPCLVEEYLSLKTYNGALGGTCLTRMNVDDNKAYQKDGYTLSSLARAISYGDFRVPQTAVVRENATKDFSQIVDEMALIDYDALQYLCIQYGTNDYFSGVPIENPENPYDEYTFSGALRSSLEMLRKSLPELQIILISPTYNWYINTGENCENLDFGGGYLKDYVEAAAKIAQEYDIGYLDLYTDFYPAGDDSVIFIYTTDGIHPNEDGRAKIAGAIADYIEKQ